MASEHHAADYCSSEEACPVHLGNIHERRPAALVARAFPLVFLLFLSLLAVVSALFSPRLLLMLCAAFNLSICLGMTQNGLMCILGVRTLREQLRGDPEESASEESASEESASEESASEDAEDRLACMPSGTVHLVVIASYREDEPLLSVTLEALSQAEGSEAFHVALAMEAREGCNGQSKALRLREKFATCFARFEVTSHPTGLREVHLDGSSDAEVPGKASNMKWAVRQLYEQCQQGGLSLERVLLTVADADAIFHPGYFDQIGREFKALRGIPNAELHRWTMWQAPQLPFRNFDSAPVVSRIHSYMSSTFEFGGVSGLGYGGGHMTFSTFSMPLLLAVRARAFEGDVVADDHHCHLRCSFYSIRAALLEAASSSSSSRCARLEQGGRPPALCLRRVLLTVKSTMVVSEQGVLQAWRDRWNQARRHAQGVSELSFALLATWDTVCHLPLDAAVACEVMWRALRLVHQVFWMHMVPTCQAVCMLVLVAESNFSGSAWRLCSSSGPFDRALCALAGVWLPMWPVLLPMVLVVISNVLFVQESFRQPAQVAVGPSGAVWSAEDGGLGRTSVLGFGATVTLELLVFGGPMFVLYGIFPLTLAYIYVCLRGNHFEFITATKSGVAAASPVKSGVAAASAMSGSLGGDGGLA